jgi:AcrR family transcriptional regulator
MQTKNRKPNHHYHHGDLKRVLIKTAVELISEQGTGDLSLRKIAQRAGVSHAAPYRHFRDKNAILVAVAKQGFEMMLDQTMEMIARNAGNNLDRFGICGISYIDFAVRHPAHYRVMFGTRKENSYFQEEFKPKSIPVFKLLRDTIQSCQEEGLLKKGNVQEMALAAWSIVHGFAMLRIDHHIPEKRFRESRLNDFKFSVLKTLYQGLGPEEDKLADLTIKLKDIN